MSFCNIAQWMTVCETESSIFLTATRKILRKEETILYYSSDTVYNTVKAY